MCFYFCLVHIRGYIKTKSSELKSVFDKSSLILMRPANLITLMTLRLSLEFDTKQSPLDVSEVNIVFSEMVLSYQLLSLFSSAFQGEGCSTFSLSCARAGIIDVGTSMIPARALSQF
jgi:hypothetical protein